MLLLNGTPNIPDVWSVAEVSYRVPRGRIELPTKTLEEMGYVRIHWREREGEREGVIAQYPYPHLPSSQVSS